MTQKVIDAQDTGPCSPSLPQTRYPRAQGSLSDARGHHGLHFLQRKKKKKKKGSRQPSPGRSRVVYHISLPGGSLLALSPALKPGCPERLRTIPKLLPSPGQAQTAAHARPGALTRSQAAGASWTPGHRSTSPGGWLPRKPEKLNGDPGRDARGSPSHTEPRRGRHPFTCKVATSRPEGAPSTGRRRARRIPTGWPPPPRFGAFQGYGTTPAPTQRAPHGAEGGCSAGGAAGGGGGAALEGRGPRPPRPRRSQCALPRPTAGEPEGGSPARGPRRLPDSGGAQTRLGSHRPRGCTTHARLRAAVEGRRRRVPGSACLPGPAAHGQPAGQASSAQGGRGGGRSPRGGAAGRLRARRSARGSASARPAPARARRR